MDILETIRSSVFPGDIEVSWLSMRYDVTARVLVLLLCGIK